MSKILDNNFEHKDIQSKPIHIIKFNLETYKLGISAAQGYSDSDSHIIIPKLKSDIQFDELEISGNNFKTSTVTSGELITIFVQDSYSGKKSLFEDDKAVRLALYKSILSETLRLLLGNLTAVFNKTHSTDVGELINRLVPVYTAYSK